jgi:hypothetical protein
MAKRGKAKKGKKVLKKNPQKYSNGSDIPRSDHFGPRIINNLLKVGELSIEESVFEFEWKLIY